jgi:hypothetical protein
LEAALNACSAFKVDILVLPEYSVRPDTVAWLKDHLQRVPHAPAIGAGTYRVHGALEDLHFKEVFDDIVRGKERELLLSSREDSRKQEKAALMTLLQPISNIPGVRPHVQVFTRRKKYASVAMSELINTAGSEQWSPLFTRTALVDALKPSLRDLEPDVLIEAMHGLSQQRWPIQHCAELICSELFLTTSPANWRAISNQHLESKLRFGSRQCNFEDASNEIFNDLRTMAAFLSYEGASQEADGQRELRRTLLLVPACTSRSADYWIQGQASLLAAGITTVFCSAVWDFGGKGGSCFVGSSSWDRAAKTNSLVDTPYGGWSRGIYYGKGDDALGDEEQALVIADVDPVYMNEGKPRPQALPKPLRLVAHLPLIETVDKPLLADALRKLGFTQNQEGEVTATDSSWISKASKLRNDLRQEVRHLALCLDAHPRETLTSPGKPSSEAGGRTLWDIACGMPGLSDLEPYKARLQAWQQRWRQLPIFGDPPAIVDWLWVDHSGSELPTILVPPWGNEALVTQPAAPTHDKQVGAEPDTSERGDSAGLTE